MLSKTHTTLKEAKIFSFVLISQVGDTVCRAEEILTEMLNEGCTITAASGVSGDPGDPYNPWGNGFVILVRDRPVWQTGSGRSKTWKTIFLRRMTLLEILWIEAFVNAEPVEKQKLGVLPGF